MTETLSSLETPRLLLRQWQASDIESFAAMNGDPRVMEFFPALMKADQSREMVKNIEAHFQRNGFGLWAAELRQTGEFIGFVGLSRPTFEAHFTPCVEIGWRLAHAFWGQGYAPEAAQEVIRAGFEQLNLAEIVSFTATINTRSIRVMEKIGMHSQPSETFAHPRLADGHPLQMHVLYRISSSEQTQGLGAAVEV